MATAGDIIDRSLRLLGQIGSGESATVAEAADGLEALNAMVDAWNNEKLMCFAYRTETITMSSGDGTYTVGTSGDLNTTRPVEILSAYVVESNVSTEVLLISQEQYDAISDKTASSSTPLYLLFSPTIASSLATVMVWPIPNATVTLKIVTRIPVASFAATSTTVTLPPGWEKALAYNLALELAPEFEIQSPPPLVVKGAQESLAGIKRINILSQPREVGTELGALFGPSYGHIETDQ